MTRGRRVGPATSSHGRLRPRLSRTKDETEIRASALALVQPFDPVEKEVQRLKRLSNPTDSEAALWERLQDRRLDGFAFHREFKIRGWVVDFYCPAGRLIVEVDGKIHDKQRLKDSRRDEILRANWYKVRRISASAVVIDIDAAVRLIKTDLDNPSAQKRKKTYGTPGESRTYVVPIEPDAPSRPLPRRASRPNPPKRSFVCLKCQQRFVAAVLPQPRCFGCGPTGKLAMVCFSCSQQLLPHQLDSGLCGACWDNDAHTAAVQAAGPGAHGPDGFRLPQAGKGQMWRGR